MSEEDRYFARTPWSIAAEGVLALIIGALILAWPIKTVVTLTWIVGIFALLAGICALIALIGTHRGQCGVLIVWGLFSIILGCIFIAWPAVVTVIGLWVLMIWLVLYGIYRIVHAIRQPSEDHSRWLDICLGIISAVIGVVLIALPTVEGLEEMILLLGIYALIAGIILICLAGAEWSKRKHMQIG